MSDFNFDVDVHRGKFASALADNPEQAMWVLAELTERLGAGEMAEFADGIDADPAKVAAFYSRLAGLLDPE